VDKIYFACIYVDLISRRRGWYCWCKIKNERTRGSEYGQNEHKRTTGDEGRVSKVGILDERTFW